MIDISSFKSVQVKDENQRTPLLCVTASTVSFGIGALEALGKPRYARLVANDASHVIVLVGCTADDPEAFEFVKKDSDRYVRLKSRALHRLCDKLSGYTPSEYPYRVSGVVDVLPNDQPAIMFLMEKARRVSKGDDDE